MAKDIKGRLVAVLANLDLLREVVMQLGKDLGIRLPQGPVVALHLDAKALPKVQQRATLHTNAAEQNGCAIIGCKDPHRTKGYCGRHYQKLRMLEKTNRRPAGWKDYAKPGTVADLKMLRGRAASKALAQAATATK